jgi:L-ribulose-5-phosphate 3-epimerase UlaE
MRNAAHKARRAREFAAARTDADRLAVAYDWFRSSVSLLARRRVPLGYSQEVNRRQAARLIHEATEYLAALAQAIDRGKFDAGRR